MKEFRWLLGAPAIVLLAVLVYAWQIEPRRIEVVRLRLPDELARALGPRRIAFVADLHITADWPIRSRLLATLSALRPDYLLLGGDVVWYQGNVDRTIEVLKQLQAPGGVFAVLGDSDYMGRIRNCAYCHVPGRRELRRDLPVRFLRNETVELENGAVRLVGLDSEERGGWLTALAAPPGDRRPTLVLAHYPTALTAAAASRADLLLAGDTHGGQIWAPQKLLGWLFGSARANYAYGWFREGATPMFVTKGIGESILPLRLGRRPEIVLLTGGR